MWPLRVQFLCRMLQAFLLTTGIQSATAAASTDHTLGSSCTHIHPEAFGNWTLIPGVCYLVSHASGGFLDARAFCQGLNDSLRWDVADIENETEQQLIHDTIDTIQLLANGSWTAIVFWIGQNDMKTEDDWKYLNDSSNKCGGEVYLKWAVHHPKGGRRSNCVFYYHSDNNFNTFRCDSVRNYLCKVKLNSDTVPYCPDVVEDTSTEVPDECATVLPGAFGNPSVPGVCYTSDSMQTRPFDDAKRFCGSLPGGNWSLVDIEDADENLFLEVWNRDTFPKNNGYWIGQNDQEREGDFRYTVTRQCPVYLKWHGGHPYGGTSNNCAVLWKLGSGTFVIVTCTSKRYTLCRLKSDWNQTEGPPPSCNKILSNETKECSERRPDAFSMVGKPGVCYFLSGKRLTWTSAVNFCKTEGWSLVDIENAAENDMLAYRYRNFAGFGRYYWVGQNDRKTEGEWRYLSRHINPSDDDAFLSWKSGQPNDNDGSQDCIAMELSGEWHDVPCGRLNYVTCKARDSLGMRARDFSFVATDSICDAQDALVPSYRTQTRSRCAARCLKRTDCWGFGFVAAGKEDDCVLCGQVAIQDLQFKDGSRFYSAGVN